jgi:PKD repeat protein
MRNLRRALTCALTAAVSISFASAVSTSADAQDGTAQSQVVSAVPATYTPDINNGTTYAINQVGTQIFTGGSFTTESNHGSTTVINQKYPFAFNAATGAINTAFAPVLDGTVQSIEPGPSANTVYVAGSFATVNGVKSKSIVLLNTTNGSIVSGWKPVVPNGVGQAIRYVNNQLLLGGDFSMVGATAHSGLVSLNPNTGALTSYTTVQFTGHHNYGVNGTGANAGVGVNAMTVSPDGTRLVAIGNFKNANGVQRDQIAMLDLTGTSATLDPNWNTDDYTAACYNNAYDTYVRDVDWAPNGDYFVVGATGGSGTNTDGSRSLCDSAARWSATDTGTNVQPTWVDYTGNDTILSVAITNTAVYVGGHARWLNNPNAYDQAGAGAVPRPGMAALDPASGLPLTWNPGRNPRGAGAYALFASASGLYVGSDTMYFGNYKYLHKRIGYFPLTGGYVPAATTTAVLPANVYEAGPITGSTADLAYRAYSGKTIGALTTVPNTGIDWSTTRGAFMVGSTVFYGTADGAFHKASFDGKTVGTPVAIDPYDDPTWDGVATGSGGTYDGVKTGYYSELANVTGAFYSDGRLYYSQNGSSALYWRYFSPDSGIIGGQEFTVSGASFPGVAGAFLSGSTLYYANSADGSLHTVAFSNGGTNGATPSVDMSTDATVSGPALDGNDWRAHGLFAYGQATLPDQAPVASATASCANLNCSFDGTQSSDSDGTVAAYAWDFGDGSTGTGAKPTHRYATAGSYTYKLTVTDDRGTASPSFTGSVTATAPASPPIAFTAAAHSYAASTTSAKVTTPSTVVAGHTELLFVSASNATANAIKTPSGWTPVATQSALPLQTAVFRHSVAAGDAGKIVTVTLSSTSAVALELADYAGVGSTVTATTAANTTATATHPAPAATITTAGSWVVSYWTDRSSTTTGWTLPAALAHRDVVIGTGGGHTTGAIADSNGPVATGAYPAQTASVVGGSSAKAAMTTLVLTPQG